MGKTKAKNLPPLPAEHHIQFILTEHNTSPITEGRKYKISWTDQGDKTPQEQTGTSDSNGLTSLIKTKGRVPITLEIAPPDTSDCKVVGTTFSKPLDNKPIVRVSLAVTATTTTAPKSANKCEVIIVREGKQQVQYVINNVTSQGNKLVDLPYILIDVDKLEPISEKSNPKVARFKGNSQQVKTDITNCDGIDTVGIVLGNATDSENLWKDKNKKLVMYKVKPAAEGLTTFVINEQAALGALPLDEVNQKLTSELNGEVWKRIIKEYSLDDIKKLLPGSIKISTERPTKAQIEYASARSLISSELKDKLLAQISDSKSVKSKISLELECKWADLLAPIYDGNAVDPPPPENKTIEKIDKKTKQKTTEMEFSEEKFEKILKGHKDTCNRGGGHIYIPQIDLTIRPDPEATKNAYAVTNLSKVEILRRTHPYAYLALIEAAITLPFHSVTISSTWRPQVGSVFHKLGDAMDITYLEAKNITPESFSYKGAKVNDLAKQFSDFIYHHRYALKDKLYYIGDDYNSSSSSDTDHNNHLHYTIDRLAPPAECDK